MVAAYNRVLLLLLLLAVVVAVGVKAAGAGGTMKARAPCSSRSAVVASSVGRAIVVLLRGRSILSFD